MVSGTVLTDPQICGCLLTFQVQAGDKVVTVFRADPADQRLDMAFLSVGLRVILWGRGNDMIILADTIRIILEPKRDYITERKGVRLNGDPTYAEDDPGDPKL